MYAQSMFIFQITGELYITNSGINFFLYCLSGKKIRDDLKETISCCCIINSSLSQRKDGELSNVTEISTVCVKSL